MPTNEQHRKESEEKSTLNIYTEHLTLIKIHLNKGSFPLILLIGADTKNIMSWIYSFRSMTALLIEHILQTA